MIVIEIPHQSPATVEFWPEETFKARCRSLFASWDGEADFQTEKDVENIGWQLWVQDLHGGKCFETIAEAKKWAALYEKHKGHQSIRVKILADNLKD